MPAGAVHLAADYREPALAFYLGAPVKMLGNSEPDEALAGLSDKGHAAPP